MFFWLIFILVAIIGYGFGIYFEEKKSIQNWKELLNELTSCSIIGATTIVLIMMILGRFF